MKDDRYKSGKTILWTEEKNGICESVSRRKIAERPRYYDITSRQRYKLQQSHCLSPEATVQRKASFIVMIP